MSTQNIIRAWKDEEYRQSLSKAERVALPGNPAGASALSDAQLGQMTGGAGLPYTYLCTVDCTFWLCSYFCHTHPQ